MIFCENEDIKQYTKYIVIQYEQNLSHIFPPHHNICIWDNKKAY